MAIIRFQTWHTQQEVAIKTPVSKYNFKNQIVIQTKKIQNNKKFMEEIFFFIAWYHKVKPKKTRKNIPTSLACKFLLPPVLAIEIWILAQNCRRQRKETNFLQLRRTKKWIWRKKLVGDEENCYCQGSFGCFQENLKPGLEVFEGLWWRLGNWK